MTQRAHLDQVVRAARQLLRTTEATEARNAAFRALIEEDGLKAEQAAKLINDRLTRAGFTPEQIATLGVTSWNIRKVLQRGTD